MAPTEGRFARAGRCWDCRRGTPSDDTFQQRLKTKLYICSYNLPASYARKHYIILSLLLSYSTAAQLVFFFLLSVLAVVGHYATITILV